MGTDILSYPHPCLNLSYQLQHASLQKSPRANARGKQVAAGKEGHNRQDVQEVKNRPTAHDDAVYDQN